MDIAEFKERFDIKVQEKKDKKVGKNVKMFNDEKYKAKIKRLEEMREDQYKWLPEDYELAKNYHVVDAIDKDDQIKPTLIKIEKKAGNKKM